MRWPPRVTGNADAIGLASPAGNRSTALWDPFRVLGRCSLGPPVRSCDRVVGHVMRGPYLHRASPMTNSCPDCGATVEFSASTARVLHGDCSGCGHAFTILEGLPAIPQALASAAEEGEAAASPEGPACGSCGEVMVVRTASDTTLDAVCSGCGSHFSYALATAPAEREPARRPRRFEPVERERGGFERDRPPSRPCRECGGALQFSTGEDGMVTGECAQCGNRFTLPPRREGGGRDGGRPPFRRPGGAGGFRPRYGGGGGGYSRGGERRGPPRSGGSSFRRRPPRDDDDDDGADRRRRRPRRE
jgi:hypothetical protein